MQLRIGEFGAVDAAADQRAAHAEPFDGVLQLLGREIGVGQRDRGEADEAVRRLAADLGEFFVLQFDNLGGEVALGIVPEFGLTLSASMSMPCSSMILMRSGVMTNPGNRTFCPINSSASGMWQWA